MKTVFGGLEIGMGDLHLCFMFENWNRATERRADSETEQVSGVAVLPFKRVRGERLKFFWWILEPTKS